MANKGLGRGLGSLLGILDEEEKEIKTDEKIEKPTSIAGETVVTLDMGMIDVNPDRSEERR